MGRYAMTPLVGAHKIERTILLRIVKPFIKVEATHFHWRQRKSSPAQHQSIAEKHADVSQWKMCDRPLLSIGNL